MEFRHILYFIKLTECESISQAARELYISQQALSQSINKLENELGVRLLLRTNQGIQLTNEGKYLKNKFRYICVNYEEAVEETYDYFNLQRGNLEFCVAPGVFRSIPPKYLIEFQKRYPTLNLEQIEVADLNCEEYVKQDVNRFGISTKPWHLYGFQYVPLHREPLFFIANKNHPLANRTHISMQELKNVEFVAFNRHYNIFYRTNNGCRKAGFTPNIVYKSADVSQLVKLVDQNAGVLICVRHVYEESSHENLVCIPIVDEEMYWEVGAIFQEYNKLPKNAKTFINYMYGVLNDKNEEIKPITNL